MVSSKEIWSSALKKRSSFPVASHIFFSYKNIVDASLQYPVEQGQWITGKK
jgi:hypothetical protein